MTFTFSKTYTIPTVTQITTPNKNISSTFMKNDTSYFIKEDERIITESVTIILDEDISIMDSEDKLLVHESLSIKFKNIEKKKMFQKQAELYNEIKNILKKNILCIKKKSVVLLLREYMSRSEIVLIIDIFMRFFSVNGLVILPQSIALAISKNSSSALVITGDKETLNINIVEDSILVIKKRIEYQKEYQKLQNTTPGIDKFIKEDKSISIENIELSVIDDNDYTEEFKIIEDNRRENLKYCNLCKIFIPLTKLLEHTPTHIKSGICICENTLDHTHLDPIGDNLNINHFKYMTKDFKGNIKEFTDEFIEGYLKTCIDPERLKKLGEPMCIGNIETKYKKYKNKDLGRGGYIVSKIEMFKDLMIFNKEWENGRLRALKEKLLFYI